ncbi:LytR C-terminal domain-containing protein [Nocardia sp. CDC153]|uniref:LytR C-terminal domain-containing protein n=1 Tax=Nocardia sp. CDC153 TaxID=3112167 RepID=UPI002DBF4CA9|nr:LytR C-terminal domain-containing protein [Nocardia sp. CDC153]MEC3958664.1 LytR C-terminal domain-containing protein [Nocardia sp. CDC153]
MSTPNSPSGGPPLRALAMVLIALSIVFAGIGAMSLSSSDSSGASSESSSQTSSAAPTTTAAQQNSAQVTTPPVAPTTTAALPTTTTTTPPAPTTTAAAGIDKTVPVRVYNNGTIPGLAKKTGDQLSGEGYNVTEVGNYPNGVIPKTTVYYGSSPKEQALAQAIAAELGCSAEPRFPGISDSPTGVIVIVTGG